MDLFNDTPPPDEYNVLPPVYSAGQVAYSDFEDAYGQWRAAVSARCALPTQTLVVKGLERELRDAKEILEDMKIQRRVCLEPCIRSR
jgi:hypothetical protein